MKEKKSHIKTIGIALSYVPEYSETFFKNKILGLQKNNYRIILFVDYKKQDDINHDYEIVYAPKRYRNKIKRLINDCFTLIKAFLFYPKKSLKLFKLDCEDGVSFINRVKNIILNQFYFTKKIDWLHFGFGMNALNKENVASVIGAKMAVSFRGSDLYLTPLKHENCYDKLFSKNVKYHVLSEEMKQTLVNYNINLKNIKVITPAINVDFFKSTNIIEPSNKLQLTTVARLHWKKGLEYTLEALYLLKQQGVDFKFTIIGEGVERERLIFAANQLGIINNVEFKGKLNPNMVKAHLQATDIYIQYSIQEGFCNAVLEAQSMGLLCIVSNAEGLPENVINNQTGWVIPKRDPKALANKIIEINALPLAEKVTIRKNAIKRVNEKFNLKNQKQKFIKFYN